MEKKNFYIPFTIDSILVIIYFFKMKLINPIIIPPISTLIATPWLELIGWFLSNSLIVWILSFTLKRGKIFVHVPWYIQGKFLVHLTLIMMIY